MEHPSAAPKAIVEFFVQPLQPSDFLTIVLVRHRAILIRAAFFSKRDTKTGVPWSRLSLPVEVTGRPEAAPFEYGLSPSHQLISLRERQPELSAGPLCFLGQILRIWLHPFSTGRKTQSFNYVRENAESCEQATRMSALGENLGDNCSRGTIRQALPFPIVSLPLRACL